MNLYKKGMKILVAETQHFSKEAIAILEKVGLVECKDIAHEDLYGAFLDYDVIVFRLGFKIDSHILPQDPKCKILATPVTGLNHIDLLACAEKNIQVLSLKGETKFLKNIRATAELTLGLTLSLLRHISAAEKSVKRGEWNRDFFRGNEIFEKTVGIIGLGRLGCIVAKYFKTMGAEVIGYDPKADFPSHLVRRSESIEDVFQQSNIITLHVEYNSSTHHLINDAIFSHAAKTPFLINTSRGEIIEEHSLLRALNDQIIGGAALDVIHGEHDISADNPLINYSKHNNNLLIVPHIGGNTFESFEKTEIYIAHKVVVAIQQRN